jgi:hypothetical protein
VVAANHLTKPKPKLFPERIHDILYAKVSKVARSMKALGLPESLLESATQAITKRSARKYLGSAINYALKCASAAEFDETEILNEALAQRGIDTKKTQSAPSKKKKPGDPPEGGKNAS